LAWVVSAWIGVFTLADVVWHVGLHVKPIATLQPLAMRVIIYSDLGASVLARTAMWILLLSVVSQVENPVLYRLCLFGIVLSLVDSIPLVLVRLPVEMGYSELVDVSVAKWFELHAWGGSGIAEAIAILHLIILWTLVRSLGTRCGRPSQVLPGHRIEPV